MNNTYLLRKIAGGAVVCSLALLGPLPGLLAANGPDATQRSGSTPRKGRPVVLQGEFTTAPLILPPLPSFPPGPFQPLLHMLITAHGKLSHFGQTTASTTDQAVDVSVVPNKGACRWVFQNTKGDALWTESDLTSTPRDDQGRLTFEFTLTIIGGTGKFAGATGTLQGEGAVQGDVGYFSVAGTAWVP